MKIKKALSLGGFALFVLMLLALCGGFIGWVLWQLIMALWQSPIVVFQVIGGMLVFGVAGAIVLLPVMYLIGRLLLLMPGVEAWEDEQAEYHKRMVR